MKTKDNKIDELAMYMKIAGSSGERDFFNSAYGIFAWALREVRDGAVIVSSYPDGRAKELSMPALDFAKDCGESNEKV